jgi:hypothetical protein
MQKATLCPRAWPFDDRFERIGLCVTVDAYDKQGSRLFLA